MPIHEFSEGDNVLVAQVGLENRFIIREGEVYGSGSPNGYLMYDINFTNGMSYSVDAKSVFPLGHFDDIKEYLIRRFGFDRYRAVMMVEKEKQRLEEERAYDAKKWPPIQPPANW